MLNDDRLEKAKTCALKYLNYRPRTEQEMRLHLQNKNFNQDIIEKVIKYLQELSYLNDKNFCEVWIHNRMELKPMGKKRLYKELINKGVDSSLVKQVLAENISEEIELLLAKKLLNKKIMKATDNNRLKNENKLRNFLYRRGFDYYIIEKVINELFPE